MRKLLFAALLILASNSAFSQEAMEMSGQVMVHETQDEGRYFSYIITNEGDKPILGGTYRVFLKVNKKNISFDRNTSNLSPGETIRYTSNHLFLKDEKPQELNFVLELVTQKPRKRLQLEEGKVVF